MIVQRLVILLLVLMVVLVGCGGGESGKSKDAGSADQTEKKFLCKKQRKSPKTLRKKLLGRRMVLKWS